MKYLCEVKTTIEVELYEQLNELSKTLGLSKRELMRRFIANGIKESLKPLGLELEPSLEQELESILGKVPWED